MNSSRNGSKRPKVLLDTNVIYSALHNPSGLCGRIMMLGAKATLDLFSIDLAREELRTNLDRKMKMNEKEIELIINGLPIRWIPREIYAEELKKAIRIVGNKPDAAFLAASLSTTIPLVTGDKELLSSQVRRVAHTLSPRDIDKLLDTG